MKKAGKQLIEFIQAARAMPENDEPHTVRFNECSGEARDLNVHGLAHYVYDHFAWFDEVTVRKIKGAYHILIIYSYPAEVGIVKYARRWLKDKIEAPFRTKFINASIGEIDHG